MIGVGGEIADAYDREMKSMAAHLEELPLERVVTHRVPLEDAEDAVRLSESDEALKVVFAPNG